MTTFWSFYNLHAGNLISRTFATFSTNWGAPSPSVPYKIPPTIVLIRFAREVGSCIQIQSFTIPVTQTSCDIMEWATNCKHHLFAPHTISHFSHASLLRQRFFQRCRVLLPQHPYPKSCSSQTWPNMFFIVFLTPNSSEFGHPWLQLVGMVRESPVWLSYT